MDRKKAIRLRLKRRSALCSKVSSSTMKNLAIILCLVSIVLALISIGLSLNRIRKERKHDGR